MHNRVPPAPRTPTRFDHDRIPSAGHEPRDRNVSIFKKMLGIKLIQKTPDLIFRGPAERERGSQVFCTRSGDEEVKPVVPGQCIYCIRKVGEIIKFFPPFCTPGEILVTKVINSIHLIPCPRGRLGDVPG
jgi:hypothetical protein